MQFIRALKKSIFVSIAAMSLFSSLFAHQITVDPGNYTGASNCRRVATLSSPSMKHGFISTWTIPEP